MERLTIKDNDKLMINLKNNVSIMEALQKLKKLEDIEEEFGIDLINHFNKKKKVKDLTISEIFNICKNNKCSKCPLFLKDNIYNVKFCLKMYIYYGNLSEEIGNREIDIKGKKNKKK